MNVGSTRVGRNNMKMPRKSNEARKTQKKRISNCPEPIEEVSGENFKSCRVPEAKAGAHPDDCCCLDCEKKRSKIFWFLHEALRTLFKAKWRFLRPKDQNRSRVHRRLRIERGTIEDLLAQRSMEKNNSNLLFHSFQTFPTVNRS